jgi:hypothetical protein
MNTARSKGFILTLVIVALGSMAVFMAVLTAGTEMMLMQTDRMYLSAIESDLISSGTAWASTRLSQGDLTGSSQDTRLDVNALSDRPCSLSARLANRTDSEATVDISTFCRKSRLTQTRTGKYAIPAR